MYTNCGNHCFEMCPDGQIRLCPLYCQAGCFCKAGYKRNDKGVCVKEWMCAQKSPLCRKNEEWRYGNSCLERCDKAQILCMWEYVQGCHCIEGHLRDPKTGRCIPVVQCPLIGERE